MATPTRQRNDRNAGNFPGRVLVGVLVRLAAGEAAALAREERGAPVGAFVSEFAKRHPFLGRCGPSVLLPALRKARGMPEPQHILMAAEQALRRLKEARARFAEDSGDAAFYEMLAAEREYMAVLKEAKEYWDWGVEEEAKNAVVGGWLR